MTEVKPVNENILQKIKGMLSTAAPNSGSSPAEAESAMLMAQRIMAKHGIEMSDVLDTADAPSKEVIHGDGTKLERKVWWKGRLASVIAANFRCVNYYTDYGGGKIKVRFIGVKEDVEMAVEVFQFACTSIEYHAKKYLVKRKKEAEKEAGVDFKNMELHSLKLLAENYKVDVGYVAYKYSNDQAIFKMRLIMATKDAMGISINPTALKNDFISGFISGLKDKFKEQVESENWGLILVKDALVVQEAESMKFVAGKQSSAKGGGDREAKAAGYVAGKSFNGAAKDGIATAARIK